MDPLTWVLCRCHLMDSSGSLLVQQPRTYSQWHLQPIQIHHFTCETVSSNIWIRWYYDVTVWQAYLKLWRQGTFYKQEIKESLPTADVSLIFWPTHDGIATSGLCLDPIVTGSRKQRNLLDPFPRNHLPFSSFTVFMQSFCFSFEIFFTFFACFSRFC